jgi:hypothetical protein
MEPEHPDQPLIVKVPDSDDARLFIELSSYASDLTEALSALDMALDSDGDARPFLIGFAVVAYWRCFGLSKVRVRLDEHVEIPERMLKTHQLVKVFRDATIAHSQSELAVTHPVAVLDSHTLEVKDVSALTVISTLPSSVARDFKSLIEAVQELLDEAIEPIRGRLESDLRRADRTQLLADATLATIDRLAADFDPNTRRAKYPAAQTFYWD